MSGFLGRLRERQAAAVARLPRWWNRALVGALIVVGIVLPFLFPADSGFMNGTIIAVAYAVMSLGLNIVVGFAGLLDLGYVAFYALGAYSLGWFGSGFFFKLHIHVLVSPLESTLQGVHLNFVLILIAAALICAAAGVVIGLPTLRLRGDYIAIVTLAFGEIIGTLAVNGQSIPVGGGMTLTAGGNLGISAVDSPYFPGSGTFGLLDLGNTALTHVSLLAGLAFTASAFCQARARLPLAVFQTVLLRGGQGIGLRHRDGGVDGAAIAPSWSTARRSPCPTLPRCRPTSASPATRPRAAASRWLT